LNDGENMNNNKKIALGIGVSCIVILLGFSPAVYGDPLDPIDIKVEEVNEIDGFMIPSDPFAFLAMLGVDLQMVLDEIFEMSYQELLDLIDNMNLDQLPQSFDDIDPDDPGSFQQQLRSINFNDIFDIVENLDQDELDLLLQVGDNFDIQLLIHILFENDLMYEMENPIFCLGTWDDYNEAVGVILGIIAGICTVFGAPVVVIGLLAMAAAGLGGQDYLVALFQPMYQWLLDHGYDGIWDFILSNILIFLNWLFSNNGEPQIYEAPETMPMHPPGIDTKDHYTYGEYCNHNGQILYH
jgi:hypothetical protein